MLNQLLGVQRHTIAISGLSRVRTELVQLLDFRKSHPRDRKQRLLKMRREIAQIARNEARSLCNCEQITVAETWFLEEFAAKMEISCPIHGPCRLGIIVSVMGYPSNGDPRDRRLAELLREYHWRRVTYRNPEVKHDEP